MPIMKLATYLTNQKITYEAFGQTVGASAFGVGKWARGTRMPRPDMLSKIKAATGGAVTADDFLTSEEPQAVPSEARA